MIFFLPAQPVSGARPILSRLSPLFATGARPYWSRLWPRMFDQRLSWLLVNQEHVGRTARSGRDEKSAEVYWREVDSLGTLASVLIKEQPPEHGRVMPQAVTVRRIKKVDRLVGGHVVESSGEHYAHIALLDFKAQTVERLRQDIDMD